MSEKARVCVDLDGVLNLFDEWRGADYFHPPRPGAAAFLKTLYECNYEIVIHTVRWAPHVWDWLRQHRLDSYVADVTNLKLPAHVYIDDRAVCFRGDFEATLKEVGRFRPHYEGSIAPEVAEEFSSE